uniref:Uncharacterized protein n=1 Tax=Anguilla anguilla TaxID=7936 RepID=A0A0E9S796_ANGAN
MQPIFNKTVAEMESPGVSKVKVLVCVSSTCELGQLISLPPGLTIVPISKFR